MIRTEMVSNFKFKTSEIGYFNDTHSDKAVEAFRKGCRIIGLTNGQFSLIDLVHSVLKKTGPARVIIGTWSAGIKDVHQVKWMMDSDLILDFKLLTDHSYKTRQKKYAASIEDLFGIENIRTSEMHAKFVLIKNDDYQVAIRSSMNLNANRTSELFEIDECEEIYNFLYKYVDHAFENMDPGFIDSSTKVNACVKAFFDKHKGEELPREWWTLKSE
jgi:hypothetical protein